MCVCRANKSDLSACLPTRCGCRKHGRECRCSSCCCQCEKIEVSKPRFYTKLVRAHADWPTIAFEAHLCIAHSTMACSFYYVAHQPSSFGQCCCWLSVQRHVVAICVLYINIYGHWPRWESERNCSRKWNYAEPISTYSTYGGLDLYCKRDVTLGSGTAASVPSNA